MVPWTQLRESFLRWMRTDLRSELTHFNLVIRQSTVKQLAIPFTTFWQLLGAPDVFATPSNFHLYSSEAAPNSQKPLFSLMLKLLMQHAAWKMAMLFRCGDFFLLMVVWWGWTFRASNSFELEQPFNAHSWVDRLPAYHPFEGNRTTL